MKIRRAWLIFILLSLSIVSVSAFVYEQAQQAVTQNIKEVATFNLQNSALGAIEEGETKIYTSARVPPLGGSGDATIAELGDAIGITTAKDNVYLYLSSDLDALATYYTTYTVEVIFSAVPTGSSHTVGSFPCSLTIADPHLDYPVVLDVAGPWAFDFKITTTAKSVESDQSTSLTITATVESTYELR